MLLTIMPFSAFAVSTDSPFYVLGNLPGTSWDRDGTGEMNLNSDTGLYERIFDAVPAGDYQLKIYTEVDGEGTWFGTADGLNVRITVTDTCDVTITFDAATETIGFSGDYAEAYDNTPSTFTAAGNGTGRWLNGVSWDPSDTSNQLTEVEDGIYTIKYQAIPAGSYDFKIACDSSWNTQIGGTFSEFGVATSAVVADGVDIISFTITRELADVEIKIDISGYDFNAKSGEAYFTVTETDSALTLIRSVAATIDTPVAGDIIDETLTFDDASLLDVDSCSVNWFKSPSFGSSVIPGFNSEIWGRNDIVGEPFTEGYLYYAWIYIQCADDVVVLSDFTGTINGDPDTIVDLVGQSDGIIRLRVFFDNLAEGELDNVNELTVDNPVSVSETASKYEYVSFTAPESGKYIFTYTNETDVVPSYALYNSDRSSDKTVSGTEADGNTVVNIEELTSGETKYFVVDPSQVPFSLSVTKHEIEYTELTLDTPVSVTYEGLDIGFKFTPTEDGKYNFASSNLATGGDPNAALYDSEMNRIIYIDNENLDNRNFLIVATLTADETYYYIVNAAGNTSFDVTLSKVADESVGELVLGTPYSINDAYNNPVKLKFVPDTTGTYIFASSDRTGDPYAELLDSELNSIATGDDEDGYNFKITAELVAGKTYYILLKDYMQEESYKVTVTMDGAGGGDDSIDVLVLDTPVTVTGADADATKKLKFTPEETGTYVFTSSANTGDPRAYLYDSDDNQIAEDDDGGTEVNFRISAQLTAGVTYVLEVYDLDGSSESFDVTVTKLDLSSIEAIVLDTPVTVTGADTDTRKQFTFTPEETGYYSFTSSDNTGDPRAWLYDSDNNQIAENDDGAGNYNFHVVAKLTAGVTYFLEVYDLDGSDESFVVTAEKYTAMTGTVNALVTAPALGAVVGDIRFDVDLNPTDLVCSDSNVNIFKISSEGLTSVPNLTNDGWEMMNTDETFTTGYYYAVYVIYSVTGIDDITYTVNGNPATDVRVMDNGTSVAVLYVFDPLTSSNTVNITVAEPTVGATISNSYSIVSNPTDLVTRVADAWWLRCSADGLTSVPGLSYEGWENVSEGDTFESGYYYAFCIQFNTSVTDARIDDLVVKINGKTAECDYVPTNIYVVGYTFAPLTSSDTVNITVSEPTVGATVSNEYSIVSNPTDLVTDVIGDPYWLRCSADGLTSVPDGSYEGWENVSEGDTFELGYYYRFCIDFNTSVTDAQIEDLVVKINGKTAECVYMPDNLYLTGYTFDTLTHTIVKDKIFVTIPEPAIGETVPFELSEENFSSDPSDLAYSILGCDWAKCPSEGLTSKPAIPGSDWLPMTVGETFEEGYYYAVMVCLGGFSTDAYTDILINGEAPYLTQENAGQLYACAIFDPLTADSGNVINSIDVTLESPAIGAPVYHDLQYVIDPTGKANDVYVNWSKVPVDAVTEKPTAFDSSTFIYVEDGEVFEAGYYYWASVTVIPVEGYNCSELTEITINGSAPVRTSVTNLNLGDYTTDVLYAAYCFDPLTEPSTVTEINYTPSVSTVNTFNFRVDAGADDLRVAKLQIIEENGGTRTYDRFHNSVTITAYDADGNVCSDLSRDKAYEIWTLSNINLPSKINYSVIAIYQDHTRETYDEGYKFTVSLKCDDAEVYDVELESYEGTSRYTPATATTGLDVTGIRFVRQDGATQTYYAETYATEVDGKLIYSVPRLWASENGTNTYTVMARVAGEWREVGSTEYNWIAE